MAQEKRFTIDLKSAKQGETDPEIREQLHREARYHHYIERQTRDVARLRAEEQERIPEDFDFRAVKGLSAELLHKLEQVRPASLAQAGRIDGMTPAALTLILGGLRRKKLKSA